MHALYKCKNDDKNNNETSSNEISLPGNQLAAKKQHEYSNKLFEYILLPNTINQNFTI